MGRKDFEQKYGADVNYGQLVDIYRHAARISDRRMGKRGGVLKLET